MLPKILKVAKLLGLHEVAKMPKRAIQVRRGELSERTHLQKLVKLKALCCELSLTIDLDFGCDLVWIENRS